MTSPGFQRSYFGSRKQNPEYTTRARPGKYVHAIAVTTSRDDIIYTFRSLSQAKFENEPEI